MREIQPYRSLDEALRDLDNGGGFLDLFSRSNDGVITMGELARAAGLRGPAVLRALYFDAATCALSDMERGRLRDRFDARLRRTLASVRPSQTSPHRFVHDAEPGRGYVVSGVARLRPTDRPLGTYLHEVTVGREGKTWRYPRVILERYRIVDLVEARGSRTGWCPILVHRREAPRLQGHVRVAGVAVRYVLVSGTTSPTLLLPAYVTPLG